MASLFKDPNKLSAYRDRRFHGNQEEYEHALQTSITVYVGNMSFYTTEEQVYELFSRAGEIKKIIMGLDKNTKTPCGFCFVLYYSREDAEDSVKYISGTILDDRPIRVDFDWGFEEGRQWGRGRSGGQVRDEYRTDYDPGRGGYGKLIQRELEVQRQLVDYGGGSLDSFQPSMPSHYGGHGGDRGHGGYRQNRDYNRKRYRDDDERSSEYESRNSDRDSRLVYCSSQESSFGDGILCPFEGIIAAIFSRRRRILASGKVATQRKMRMMVGSGAVSKHFTAFCSYFGRD